MRSHADPRMPTPKNGSDVVQAAGVGHASALQVGPLRKAPSLHSSKMVDRADESLDKFSEGRMSSFC